MRRPLGAKVYNVKCFVLICLLPVFFDQALAMDEADSFTDDIQTIRAAGPNGTGAAQARAARDRLAQGGVELLPRLLAAMDTDNPLAANWFRTAFDEILLRPNVLMNLPLAKFKQFVRDPRRQGKVRRMLLDLIEQNEPGFRARLVPTLVGDPEFRVDAVDEMLRQADAARQQGDEEKAKTLYRTAFANARQSGQVTRAADRLKAVGEEVDVIAHMGFLVDWHLLGPFDAPGKTGYERSFPPEMKVDLTATYQGKDGKQIAWQKHRTPDRMGLVNLAQAIAPVKEAVGYAYAEVHSPRRQQVELRCGADDNLTVWLNGKKVFTRLQWLNGIRLDRFTAPVTLEKGTNRLLVKVCQGPQHKNPAVPNNWSMQLRFCGADGSGVGVTTLSPTFKE